jgi:acetoin utilization deacetylase AcuC-like enzyme
MVVAAVLNLPVVWADGTLLHAPEAEIWIGVRTVGTEVPERATVIRDAVAAAGARIVPAVSHDDTVLRTVHGAGLLRHLETVYAEWVARGYQEHQHDVVPYVFPTAGMLDGLPARDPYATHGRAGRYCYDTMTLVGPGTWAAARAAVDTAQTAAGLVAGGEPVAYAICRPPGHHVTRDAYGGSCYLNNAAVAVEALRVAGVGRVAVVDIDAHHGNGTQAVFYERPDVFYGSVHVDPAAGWFPHYAGYADETGRGAAAGTNRNEPIAPETGDEGWLAALSRASDAVSAFRPEAVVVSLGVDAAADDPESPLRVTADGYRRSGALIRELGVPIVAVHEGGYHLPTLGALTVATLAGLTDDQLI